LAAILHRRGPDHSVRPTFNASESSIVPIARQLWNALKGTVSEWLDLGVFHWGAALAYYSVFSLTPLLVLGITGLGTILGRGAVRREVVSQTHEWLGAGTAQVVRQVMDRLQVLSFESPFIIPSMLMLLVGATAVFANVQAALNHIWRVEPQSGIVRNLLRTRLMSIAMIFVLAGVMVLSVVLSAAAEATLPHIPDAVASTIRPGLLADGAVTLVVLWVLLSLTFAILPDARIAWRDVWAGAGVTAVLLYVGKFVLGFYFGHADLGSAFGAAGSVFTFLVWIYYSAQVFFLGAIFTRVWADQHGAPLRPESYASFVETRTVRRRRFGRSAAEAQR
jgi:membrane protein